MPRLAACAWYFLKKSAAGAISLGVGTQNSKFTIPLSLDLSLLLMAVYGIPTIPPPIILGFNPSSRADCTMPTEVFGYEQITTSSGLVAWMARMIGETSVVFGG